MTATTQVGPSDNLKLPKKSLGIIFYNKIKEWDPSRVAIVDGTSEVNYGNLLKLSIRLAKEIEKLGVKKGDVVTIVSENNWKYLVTIISCFYIGAEVNLLNHDYTSGELKHLLAICRPVLIFCSTKTLHTILELENEPFFPNNIITYDEDSSPSVHTFDKLIEDESGDDSFSPIELNPKEDVALILTSSGTTGLPKCVQLTHANFRTTMLYAGDPDCLDVNKNESLIGFLPFFHIFGSGVSLASILYGAKFITLQKFVPDRFLNIIQEYKITKLFVVPPIFLFLVKSPMVQKYDISSITDVLCGAAAVTKELEEMVEEKLHFKSIRQIYGMTEVSGGATIIPKNLKKSGSVGKVTFTHEIKVCDVENGNPLPPHQIGELRIRGGGVMKGYLGKVEDEAFDDEGFFKSGDLGYYDEEGYFFIVDRLKEIIKYKGFQVSPVELETLLMQHPAVKDAGVIGIPNERAGEVPLAFVVKQPARDVTEEELINYVAENISVQKHLYGGVRFIQDIPKSSSGKILRKNLKKLI